MEFNEVRANLEDHGVDQGLGMKHIFLSGADLEKIVETKKIIEKRYNGNGYESKTYTSFLKSFVKRICAEDHVKEVMIEHVPITEEDREIFRELEAWLNQEIQISADCITLIRRINEQITGKFSRQSIQ